jgi:hypothetical protein
MKLLAAFFADVEGGQDTYMWQRRPFEAFAFHTFFLAYYVLMFQLYGYIDAGKTPNKIFVLLLNTVRQGWTQFAIYMEVELLCMFSIHCNHVLILPIISFLRSVAFN